MAGMPAHIMYNTCSDMAGMPAHIMYNTCSGMAGMPANIYAKMIYWACSNIKHPTCGKVDCIRDMHPSLPIPTEHVYPVRGVLDKGLDFNSSVQREEVFH